MLDEVPKSDTLVELMFEVDDAPESDIVESAFEIHDFTEINDPTLTSTKRDSDRRITLRKIRPMVEFLFFEQCVCVVCSSLSTSGRTRFRFKYCNEFSRP